MSKVKVYIKPYCPYCSNVISYLEKNNISYEEIDVQGNSSLYEKVKSETGHGTVPQVFIDGKFIGGSDDFFHYISKNQLRA
jgi:glutaredoxin 3